MVAYHRPIPERRQRGGAGGSAKGGLGDGLLNAWVQAEKMIQIALMLPSAAFIGWLAGYGLDRWLHQTWITTAGIVFGIVAGLVGAIRMAMFYGADPALNRPDKNGNRTGNSAKTGNSGTSR